jgi:hypothetical protein
MDEKPSSLLRSRCYPDRGCKTPAPVREERENGNVRALLLVAIWLSALSTAQAEQAPTFQASVDVLDPPDYRHFGKITVGDEDNPFQRPVWASQLQPAPK